MADKTKAKSRKKNVEEPKVRFLSWGRRGQRKPSSHLWFPMEGGWKSVCEIIGGTEYAPDNVKHNPCMECVAEATAEEQSYADNRAAEANPPAPPPDEEPSEEQRRFHQASGTAGAPPPDEPPNITPSQDPNAPTAQEIGAAPDQGLIDRGRALQAEADAKEQAAAPTPQPASKRRSRSKQVAAQPEAEPEQARMSLTPSSLPHVSHTNILLDQLPSDEELHGDPPEPDFVQSVRDYGVLEPILVIDKGPQAHPRHIVADGRNRIKAARAAVKMWEKGDGQPEKRAPKSIPAAVFPADWTPAGVLSLVANQQRRNNPVSDLAAIELFIHQGYSRQEIQVAVGLQKGEMASRMKLLGLHGGLKDALYAQKIGMRLAECIAREPMSRQEQLFNLFREKGKLTAKDLQAVKQAGTAASTAMLDPEVFNTPSSAKPDYDRDYAPGDSNLAEYYETADIQSNQADWQLVVSQLLFRAYEAIPKGVPRLGQDILSIRYAVEEYEAAPGALVGPSEGESVGEGPPMQRVVMGGAVVELAEMPPILDPSPLAHAAAALSMRDDDDLVERDGQLYRTMAVPKEGDISSEACPICFKVPDGTDMHMYIEGIQYCPVDLITDKHIGSGDDPLAAEFSSTEQLAAAAAGNTEEEE